MVNYSDNLPQVNFPGYISVDIALGKLMSRLLDNLPRECTPDNIKGGILPKIN